MCSKSCYSKFQVQVNTISKSVLSIHNWLIIKMYQLKPSSSLHWPLCRRLQLEKHKTGRDETTSKVVSTTMTRQLKSKISTFYTLNKRKTILKGYKLCSDYACLTFGPIQLCIFQSIWMKISYGIEHKMNAYVNDTFYLFYWHASMSLGIYWLNYACWGKSR